MNTSWLFVFRIELDIYFLPIAVLSQPWKQSAATWTYWTPSNADEILWLIVHIFVTEMMSIACKAHYSPQSVISVFCGINYKKPLEVVSHLYLISITEIITTQSVMQDNSDAVHFSLLTSLYQLPKYYPPHYWYSTTPDVMVDYEACVIVINTKHHG